MEEDIVNNGVSPCG